ncbi:MAG TPA: tetratricopeptide repeat protein [Rhizobiales bacterium]|nr:tetratricopeptide repeat protein [Hyphomicrobiales bacterium]
MMKKTKASSLKLAVAASMIVLPSSFIATQTAQAAINLPDVGFASHASNYLIAREAAREKDYATAALFYSRAYEENSSDQVLLERAFVLNVTTGEIARAVELAEQIIIARPDHQLARFVLGLNAAKQGKFAAARNHFTKAAPNRIGNLTSAVLIGWTWAGENQRKKAYEALDKLDDQGNLAKFKAAQKAYIADYLGDSKQAARSFKAALTRAGNSLRLIEGYGNFLWRNGQKDEARKVFANYLKLTERNPIIIQRLADLEAGKPAPAKIAKAQQGMFEVLFSLAGALSGRKSSNVALIYARLSLFMRPDLPVADVLLAEVYESINQYGKAVEAFSKIKETSPLYSNVTIQIANNLDNMGKSDEAIARLDALIAREPDNFQAWSTKGSILYGEEKWKEAAQALSLALARVKVKQRRHWAVYYYRGMSYERSGQWSRAEADFQMALKLRPAQPSVLNYLGYSWIDRGENLDEALEMVEQAAELRPRDGYIIDSVGWANYRLGNYEEAVKRLERAVKLRPGDPTINDHLGDAYWKVGRKLEAGFQWAHARDSKPDKKMLSKILNKIKNGLDES